MEMWLWEFILLMVLSDTSCLRPFEVTRIPQAKWLKEVVRTINYIFLMYKAMTNLIIFIFKLELSVREEFKKGVPGKWLHQLFY